MLVILRYYILTHKKNHQRISPLKINIIPNEQEVDDVSTLIERKFNDVIDKVEKRLHNIKDQIIGMQLSNLSGNNVNGTAVTSEMFLYVDILKDRILEL